MVVGSPQIYATARDSGEIRMLRDQFTGNYQGCRELQRLIDERTLELQAQIKQQEEDAKSKQAT